MSYTAKAPGKKHSRQTKQKTNYKLKRVLLLCALPPFIAFVVPSILFLMHRPPGFSCTSFLPVSIALMVIVYAFLPPVYPTWTRLNNLPYALAISVIGMIVTGILDAGHLQCDIDTGEAMGFAFFFLLVCLPLVALYPLIFAGNILYGKLMKRQRFSEGEFRFNAIVSLCIITAIVLFFLQGLANQR